MIRGVAEQLEGDVGVHRTSFYGLFRVSVVILAVEMLSFHFPVGCCNPGRGKNFSLLQNIHTGSEACPASYSLGTGVCP
jgi:hypothetical protein